jgi:hypothetical protein
MKKKIEKPAATLQAEARQSAFSKYRGIGNPGIGPGRKNIARWLRKLRGRINPHAEHGCQRYLADLTEVNISRRRIALIRDW